MRCDWCQDDPLLIAYHDGEWGFRAEEDDRLLEALSLSIFQAGLSWKIILHRREGFRRAFDGYSVAKVAAYGEPDLQRLVEDEAIIRNRRKIEATVHNACGIAALQAEHGSFRSWLDGLPNELSEYQRAFRSRFAFCGPEITRMFVMMDGLIPAEHDPHCRVGSPP